MGKGKQLRFSLKIKFYEEIIKKFVNFQLEIFVLLYDITRL